MEPKCPSCGDFAAKTIHGIHIDVPIGDADALPTVMLYCRKCGYNFAVIPLTEDATAIVKERVEALPYVEKEQLWMFVQFVPKPEWAK
jgi:C4-type Zn-finger protein